MSFGASQQVVATLTDWAGAAGILGGIVATVGLVVVVLQLRGAAAVSRAQATIQFQRAFRASRDARDRLQKTFPIHEDVVHVLGTPPETQAAPQTWRNLDDLSSHQRQDAESVINAMNDVAQYVADGLSLRSALQQYHTIFVRTGALLLPYLDQRNARREGHPQARYGRRVADLYNAGLAYHLCHPKHRGRELTLERPVFQDSGEVRLVLLDVNGRGVQEHPGFADDPGRIVAANPRELRRAVKAAERTLRR